MLTLKSPIDSAHRHIIIFTSLIISSLDGLNMRILQTERLSSQKSLLPN